MLSNLKAEMARANVTVAEIAAFSGKSNRTISDRIKGKGAFFPGVDLEYLFAQTDPVQDST